ncbi:Ig-like domain-containing protein [Haloferula chungangensis]|uniref:Ig-like domain-containing protein n=1 Tax=Haloferula chungangensis TaxID=1048331 RepID=A0ABW2L3U3_9BACT
MKKAHFPKPSLKILAGLTALLGATASAADFETTVATSEFPDSPGPTVSNSDLLQTAFESVIDTGLADLGGTTEGEPSLRNGIWDNNGQSRAAAAVDNDDTAEYTLDLTASPGGYTINGVDLYSNWGTGQGRDEIRVKVSFALVGTPDVFDQVLVANTEPLFVYNPPTQTQGKMSLSGFSIEGVAAIRFEWPFMQESNGVGYSEIDVFGTSTGNDVDPPTLSSSDPISGAVNVPTIQNLTFTFNEDIQAGSGTIDLRTTEPDASVETFDVTSLPLDAFSGRTLTIDPTNPLTPGVEYNLVIPAGAVDDTSGNDFAGLPPLPDAEAFVFTTDDTPPALTGTEPLFNGLPTSDLYLVFDEAIQIGAGSVTLHAAGGAVLQTIDVNGGGVTISDRTAIVEIADLEFGTNYYVNYPAGVFADVSGNEVAAVSDNATIAFSSVATSLIHFWEFEDNATDTVGTHDGTLRGGTEFGEGQFGKALDATGSTSGMNVNQSSLPATNFTLACWINPTLLTGNRHVAGTRRGATEGARIVLQAGGTPTVHLQSETNVVLGAPEKVSSEAWTHLAFSVDETNGLTLYVNGSPVASDATGVGHTLVDNFTVATRPDVIGDNYVGRIDDLRIYAEVLSDSDIAALAAAPGDREAPLVLEISQNGGKLDFEWNSMAGMQYDLVSAPDLSTPTSSWSIYNDGINPAYENIPSAGIFTSLNGVAKVGPTRFFALIEEPVPPLLSEDFEAAASIPAGWVAADNGNGTAWEAGPPTLGIPEAAANGSNCAGTNLGGNYGSSADATLTSPAFAAPAGGATLSFQRFIDTEGGAGDGGPDFGTIRILDADNADAEIINGDFPVTSLEGIELGWDQLSFPLPAAALGKNIKIQFQFVSDGSTEFSGFYIDDVTVTP